MIGRDDPAHIGRGRRRRRRAGWLAAATSGVAYRNDATGQYRQSSLERELTARQRCGVLEQFGAICHRSSIDWEANSRYSSGSMREASRLPSAWGAPWTSITSPALSAPQVMSSNRVCALVLMVLVPILNASELAAHDPVRLPAAIAPFTSSSFGSSLSFSSSSRPSTRAARIELSG